MRRWLAALAGAMALAVAASVPAGSVATVGVPRGTPVHVHTHPDNGIVSTVVIAASRVGLGPVEAVGFERNCAPNFNRVVVCRDVSLGRHGQPTATSVGVGWCVVRLDPTIGAGPLAAQAVTVALRRCLLTP